jgi:hypothetical protein
MSLTGSPDQFIRIGFNGCESQKMRSVERRCEVVRLIKESPLAPKDDIAIRARARRWAMEQRPDVAVREVSLIDGTPRWLHLEWCDKRTIGWAIGGDLWNPPSLGAAEPDPPELVAIPWGRLFLPAV